MSSGVDRSQNMDTDSSTQPVPLKQAIDEALADAALCQAVRELVEQPGVGLKGAAAFLKIHVDSVRMLIVDPTRVRRGTRAQARARLAELAAQEAAE